MIKQDRLVSTFLELVAIDNPSGEEAEMAQHLILLLRAEGLEPERDAKGNVIARVPGRGEPLLLSAHMDSVSPARGKRGVVKDGVVYSAADTVLGSDDLAGVSAILEAVRAIREAGVEHRAAEIVFSVEEEVGLKGVKGLDWSKLTAKEGVALDLNGDLGGICIAAPAQVAVHAVIRGKAAHAGVAPEQGVNAILVAAEALTRMPLGRIDEETTANIGTIAGGSARNIVPDQVELIGEARSRDPEKLRQQVDAMEQALRAAAEKHGARVEWEADQSYPPQHTDPESQIVQRCRMAMQKIGLTPRLFATGGGSDVNIYTMHGINAVNLSVGYREIHSTNEHIAISDLAKAAQLVEALLVNG